ncbi:saccharopine dehydrogenase NADP-binding domain-containing protein [Solirubrobacter phytolaccae]|uniref:Saccharopine dehydrogenase NADP-binding domain-containing protein n=1 Tax=Solirubrobacter phytolaccae TaxID=1404360 RepID=A0A9X3NF04_9ACTN|nr:saccharopine dehydrogenase NADP-binding domain-containing protein [Solirubrobacter phytolaccae]MDA0185440.1 saccharopine dehydrogenase NADP-binding domain-containing protein [Solirubrobacter phytolaccae]
MHDIVVFGATGFVGRLVAEYLDKTDADVALAGRSRSKLEALGIDRPLIVADADDPGALARSARVVCTTVGPYRKGGLKLVDACVEAGTAYCDLTGEILFAHDAVARHDAAVASGARIVLSCGFDSIPSDLGTFLLHEAAGELGRTTFVLKALRGGASGGTLASMKGQVDEMRADLAARDVIIDPASLGGSDRTRDFRAVKRDPEHGWIGPFVMATYNTRIVRRSAELLGYGPDFAYREVSAYKNPIAAYGFTACLGLLAGGLAFGPTRWVLDRVLPGPGAGPSEKARTNGFFKVQVHGGGHVATVAAKGDPGYAATAVMMGEAALTLARTDGPGGVLTPASAMGAALVERLRAAGLTLTVTPE